MDQERIPTGQKPSNSFLKYSGFALQLFGGIGLAAWLGYKLDQYLELKFPAFLLTFILLVFGGMMYQVYRNLNKE
jgi:F0F1-type ATP synthase assembly protein I